MYVFFLVRRPLNYLEENAAFGTSSTPIFPAFAILFTCDRLQNVDEKMDLQQLRLNVNGVALSTITWEPWSGQFYATGWRIYKNMWVPAINWIIKNFYILPIFLGAVCFLQFRYNHFYSHRMKRRLSFLPGRKSMKRWILTTFTSEISQLPQHHRSLGPKLPAKQEPVFRPSNGTLNMSSKLQLKDDQPWNGIDSMAQKNYLVSRCIILNCCMCQMGNYGVIMV